MTIDKGKVLIEGMDLSGKTTIAECLKSMIKIEQIQCRTLIKNNHIHDFTVQQSKMGDMPRQLISELYKLAIKEDLCKYQLKDTGILLQDSYFALRSYAYEKDYGSSTIAEEMKKYLQMFPIPEFTFYLTASTEERIERNKKRNKPMAYMEKLLVNEPEKFERIEANLKEITLQLFDAEVIDTEGKTPMEIAKYISNKIKKIERRNEEYEK